MLVRHRAHRFVAIPVLPLPSALLDLLVGDEKSCLFTPEDQSQPIFAPEIPLVPRSKPGRRSFVGEIAQNRGVEVTVRPGTSPFHSQAVLSPSVLRQGRAARRREAPPRSDSLPVKTLACIRGRDHLDDATQFSPILGGNIRGENGH